VEAFFGRFHERHDNSDAESTFFFSGTSSCMEIISRKSFGIRDNIQRETKRLAIYVSFSEKERERERKRERERERERERGSRASMQPIFHVA
jgi:hypothetical protein